ncbi:hypothetical protein JTB14_027823 [Gonioctena quinquepunctata]|nr:hypothetical protein JTB14_027823 [Gonioctena quinquepunctata]
MRDNLQFHCSHLCCSHFTKCKKVIFRMTDSMNFGPDWIRNLSSEGSTGGGTGGGTKYQLADYRYGREEMLALFDRNAKPPVPLTNFKCLYSETCLLPLALLQTSDDERGWPGRPMIQPSGPPRGRGGSLERGGRISRGRGYQYGRPAGYEGGWGNGEQPEWSPRKEYGNQRPMSMDNWRRSRNIEEDDGWRNVPQGRNSIHEKWVRSSSWRGEGDSEEKTGPPERGGRTSWNENRPPSSRRSWDNEDHLPEWATENPTEGGGTFDEKGAFHGSDDEQSDGRHPGRRETGLQKSTSQQHITVKKQPQPLTSSKSTTSLIKPEDSSRRREEPSSEAEEEMHSPSGKSLIKEREQSVSDIPEKIDRNILNQERVKLEDPPNPNKRLVVANGPTGGIQRHEDSDFERFQEDFVLKLVVDEESPKQTQNNLDMSNIKPPPNLTAPPVQDKWFYQDPQGQMQGPFAHQEMAEWYKAGYFSNQLKVRRHCDERFFLLGELITICGGMNPFQSEIRFPVLKNDVTKMPDPDILQFQYLSQMAAYKQAQARIVADPWSAITLQQQELAAQRLIMQQQQVSQDLQYLQHSQAANPLMHMINQMQQANKLPGQGLVDKPPQNIPGSLDPHLQLHMNNILSLQNRIPTAAMTNNIPTGLTNHSVPLPPESLSSSMPSLQTATPLNTGNMPLPGIQSNIPVSIGGSINIPRHTAHGSGDQINSGQNNDPISSLLKQLQQQSQHSQQQNISPGHPFAAPTSTSKRQLVPSADFHRCNNNRIG